MTVTVTDANVVQYQFERVKYFEGEDSGMYRRMFKYQRVGTS